VGWRRRGRTGRAAEVLTATAAATPAREAGVGTARHLGVIREELLELADRIRDELGDPGRPARLELLHAAGRVDGAIAEINRGAGR
jgi:hypothetical protein